MIDLEAEALTGGCVSEPETDDVTPFPSSFPDALNMAEALQTYGKNLPVSLQRCNSENPRLNTQFRIKSIVFQPSSIVIRNLLAM